ncbi:MAG TPA: outer membrane beta-barrel protein [Chthonomonadaceae bacterium]|nr:outer membrane beta-barrel protein [Chthonomonadaceae bacterium]
MHCFMLSTHRACARSGNRRARLSWLFLLACAILGLVDPSVRAQDQKPSADTKPADTKPADTKPADTKPAGAQSGDTKPAEAQQSAAAAPAGPALGTVTISGLVDVYYGINARAPRSATGGPFATIVTPSGETIGVDNVGRSFDINDREPSFSLGEVNITRTPGRGFPLGVTATLTFGDTARIVHATEPGGTSSWQTVQQLYLTYPFRAWGRDMSVDGGIFVTPFGVEVIESSSNDNYSRGFLFQYAIPLYHLGVRLTAPLTNQLTFAGYVVNGWNNIADDNDAKSVIAQFTWKPNARWTGILGWMGGSEGTGAYGSGVPTGGAGNITTNLFEGQAIYQASDKLKLAAWVDYASAAGDVNGVHLSGNWIGFAGYARYQVTPQWAVALRAEQFEDIPGVGGVGLRLGGGYVRLREATLTLEYAALRGHLISRLEYRHDHSSTAFFGADTGDITPDQDTIYLGEVYKF